MRVLGYLSGISIIYGLSKGLESISLQHKAKFVKIASNVLTWNTIVFCIAGLLSRILQTDGILFIIHRPFILEFNLFQALPIVAMLPQYGLIFPFLLWRTLTYWESSKIGNRVVSLTSVVLCTSSIFYSYSHGGIIIHIAQIILFVITATYQKFRKLKIYKKYLFVTYQ